MVVPFYNVEHYIHDCLASIARQSLADLEVILVDDGSQDGSRAVAEGWVERDPRFRILTQHNQGLGPARNTGMREAAGAYLTFVDSDDVLPRTAFARMVGRLDETGSDFAAGNALRFSADGVRQSFTHTEPFAADRSRAHIGTFPALAHDRMVWNKVYRRSFWEAGGYVFPPIRYEDYPVTLRAHLEATAVEVLAEPVYLWRERDAGEQSITQRVFEPDNIADRVASALMVLDVLDTVPEVPAAVRETVQHHLLGTDVGAVARAVALASGTPHFDAVLADAQRFVAALDEDVVDRRSRQERLRVDLIRLGAGTALRHLIDIQDELEPPLAHVREDGRLLVALQPREAAQDPGFAALPAPVRLLTEDDLQLLAAVTSSRWEGDRLRLAVQGRISFGGPVDRLTVRARLRRRGTGAELPVEVAGCASDGPVFTADLVVDGPEMLAAAGDEPSAWVLHLEVDADGRLREAPVGGTAPGAAPFAGTWRAGDGHLVTAGRQGGEYAVLTLVPEHRILEAGAGFGPELRLRGVSREPLPVEGSHLELVEGGRSMLFPVSVDPGDPTRWDAHVSLAAVADPASYDPLVPMEQALQVRVLAGSRREQVHLDPAVALVRLRHGGREVRLGAGRFLGAYVHESGPRLLLEEAGVADGTLRLAGRWPFAYDEPAIVLTWHHALGSPEEVRLPAPVVAGRFEVAVDAAGLAERTARVLDLDGAPAGVTTAAWAIALVTGGQRHPAHLATGLVRGLPDAIATPHGSVALTCHLELVGRITVSRVSRGAAGS